MLCLGLTAMGFAKEWEFSAGPQFNYVRLEFNNPSYLDGYAGGVVSRIGYHCNTFFGNLDFEGTWNASKITGEPCQRSSLSEYFLNLQLGGSFPWCSMCFDPYIGFGWDRFENTQDPSTANLCYQYDKLFIPVGFYYTWALCCTTFTLHFEWRPDVWSRLNLFSIHMSPDWAYAFRAEGVWKRWYQSESCCYTFSWIPFFDWNKFGKVREKNSVGSVLTVPELVRWNLGLKAVIGIQF